MDNSWIFIMKMIKSMKPFCCPIYGIDTILLFDFMKNQFLIGQILCVGEVLNGKQPKLFVRKKRIFFFFFFFF